MTLASVTAYALENVQGIYYTIVALVAFAVSAMVSPTESTHSTHKWHSTVNVLSGLAIALHFFLGYMYPDTLTGNGNGNGKAHGLEHKQSRPAINQGRMMTKEALPAAETAIAQGDYEKAAARNIHQLNTRAGVANTNGIAPARMQLIGQQQQTAIEEPSDFDQQHGSRSQSDMRTHMQSGYAFNRLHAEDSARADAAAARRDRQVLDDRIAQGDARIAPQRGPAGISGQIESPAQVHVPIPDKNSLGPVKPRKAQVRFEEGPTDASEGHAVQNESLAGAFASTQAGEDMDPAQVERLIQTAGAD